MLKPDVTETTPGQAISASAVPVPLPPLASSLARLLSRTVPGPGGCLIWQGAKPRGYGMVKFEGKSRLAHRVAYTLARGPIPSGMCVMHTCDTPPCLNPLHLVLGTQLENIRDRDTKGRHARGRPRAALGWELTHANPERVAEVAASEPRSDAYLRFWQRVDRSAGCWEWRGQKQRQGYGQVGWAGKRYSAHRFAWLIMYGPIPDGQAVCHRCDNPGCVRPDHLYLATAVENTRDMIRKGRHVQGDRHWTRQHPDRVLKRFGEQNPAAKLTEEQVRDIRLRYSAGGVSMARLAAEFGVNPSTVFYIVRSVTWAETNRSTT